MNPWRKRAPPVPSLGVISDQSSSMSNVPGRSASCASSAMMIASSCASERMPPVTSLQGRRGAAFGMGGATAAIATLSTSGDGCSIAPAMAMRCGAYRA